MLSFIYDIDIIESMQIFLLAADTASRREYAEMQK